MLQLLHCFTFTQFLGNPGDKLKVSKSQEECEMVISGEHLVPLNWVKRFKSSQLYIQYMFYCVRVCTHTLSSIPTGFDCVHMCVKGDV